LIHHIDLRGYGAATWMASLRRVLVGNAATKGKDLSVSSELEEPDREFVNIVCIYIIYIYIYMVT
jgi:hypothetical protein